MCFRQVLKMSSVVRHGLRHEYEWSAANPISREFRDRILLYMGLGSNNICLSILKINYRFLDSIDELSRKIRLDLQSKWSKMGSSDNLGLLTSRKIDELNTKPIMDRLTNFLYILHACGSM